MDNPYSTSHKTLGIAKEPETQFTPDNGSITEVYEAEPSLWGISWLRSSLIKGLLLGVFVTCGVPVLLALLYAAALIVHAVHVGYPLPNAMVHAQMEFLVSTTSNLTVVMIEIIIDCLIACAGSYLCARVARRHTYKLSGILLIFSFVNANFHRSYELAIGNYWILVSFVIAIFMIIGTWLGNGTKRL